MFDGYRQLVLLVSYDAPRGVTAYADYTFEIDNRGGQTPEVAHRKNKIHQFTTGQTHGPHRHRQPTAEIHLLKGHTALLSDHRSLSLATPTLQMVWFTGWRCGHTMNLGDWSDDAWFEADSI